MPSRHAALMLIAVCIACSSDDGPGADTTRPSIPGGLTATPTSTTAIQVTWSAATDDRGVSGYQLHRDGRPHHDTPLTQYDDIGLAPGTTYCYRVLASDDAGNQSPPSDESCATTPETGETLTITMAGSGAGTVTSSPAGISCGADCAETYASGTSVTLTAEAGIGSTFVSWTGCTTSSGTACTVSMSATKGVTATFDLTVPSYTLTVTKSGSDAGTVTSSPAGISCGTDCSQTYVSGASVVLTATPDPSPIAVTTTWSGCDASTATTCTVAMTRGRDVTAAFNSDSTPRYELATLPATSSTGSYTVTWSCVSALCSTVTHLQEAPDTTFASFQRYTLESNVRSKTFTAKANGTYCYRVAAAFETNWSAPKCIIVSLPTPQTVTLQAVANNIVESASLDPAAANKVFANYYPAVGINSFANLGGGASQAFASAVKFNMSTLAGKTIDSATLNLQAKSAGVGYYPKDFKIAAIASTWSATTLTWNVMANMQYYTASWQTFSYPTYSGAAYAINLKATVQSWANGTFANNGLGFLSASYSWPGNVTSFDAYEFWVPTLTVTYH